MRDISLLQSLRRWRRVNASRYNIYSCFNRLHLRQRLQVKDISRMVNLPLVSIPHALQAPLNGLAVNGVRASFAALNEFIRDPAQREYSLSRVGAMSQETAYENNGRAKKSSTFQILLDPLRKVFSAERRVGIAYSAVMGKHACT